ncbi:MAG: UDP-2,3-diacylglucosamine diphosphatase [Rikenellaceae bacterium]
MIYFASDVHLGSGGRDESRRVEALFVEWLERVSKDADAIFLCGDIFDFWFEYKHVVPKGFVRSLAQIAKVTDRGVRVVYMAGNHDMWLGDYLNKECGVEIYTSPERFTLNGRVIHVAHGDNLNVTGDWKLQIINTLFRSKFVRVAFSWFVHPDIALKFGLWWSDKSREKHFRAESDNTLGGKGIEPLVEYAAQQQEISPCDHYIYGHLHQTLQHQVLDSSQREYLVTFVSNWNGGSTPTYAKLDRQGNMTIEKVE